MKTATATPVAYEAMCPACREAVECPVTGSLMLTAESVRALRNGFGVVSCLECGAKFKLPAKVVRLGEDG